MNREIKTLIFIVGIISDIGLFGLYFALLQTNLEFSHIQTIMFTALGINSLFYVFSVRSFRTSIFRINPFQNPWLNVAVFGGAFLQLAAVYFRPLQKILKTVPLGLSEWGIILVLATIKLFCIELTKEFFIIRRRRNAKRA